MESLPLQTQPPQTPTYRRHNPPQAAWEGGYREYKSCLRWDFGFSCAFCLLHEADFCPQGSVGVPVFSAEHLDPQSTGQKVNDYGNVIYACCFCNRSRLNKPRITPEGQLLDPTVDAWADHFQAQENYLAPKENNENAIYTHQAYDLDDPRKVTRRAERHRRLLTLIEMIQGLPFVDELIIQAEQEGDQSKLEKSRRLRAGISKAIEAIKLYAPVPHDAPTQCRCKTTDMHNLPDEFAKQIMQIPSFP